MSREQRWLRRGMFAVVMLALAAMLLTVWSLVVALESRREAIERADDRLVELGHIADRLDEQAVALEAQADRLDAQATALEEAQAETARSREQFRVAATLLLEALGVEDRPFAPKVEPAPEPEPQPQAQAESTPHPEPEPSEPGRSGDNRNQPKKDNPQSTTSTGPLPCHRPDLDRCTPGTAVCGPTAVPQNVMPGAWP